MIIKDVSGLSMRISEQSWDSDTFGFKCGWFEISRSGADRISRDGALTGAMAEMTANARTDGFRFLTLKCDAPDIGIVNAALKSGGSLIDTEITFAKERSAGHGAGKSLPGGYAVRKCDRYWDDSLYELADTLQHSRFFSDPKMDTDLARKAWKTSIYNNSNGRASYSIVCFHEDTPVGLMNVFEKEETSDVFLVAVSPAHQSRGIGRAMMDVYEQSLGSEILRQIVETQLINYGAQRLYAGRGYRASKAKHIVHFWL